MMADVIIPAVAPMPPNIPVSPSNSSVPTQAIEQPRLPVDFQKLRALGSLLVADFKTFESHRRLAEEKWARNLRQFLGEYDDQIKRQLDSNRSQAYPRVTRVKCVSMLARLMNLLFPTVEKNWGLEASPVPNLSMEDLATVLQAAQEGAQQAQAQLTDAVIESAVRAFSKVRADNLEREIEDQLAEIGGSRHLSYVHLCRRVLASGILYGVGVLKGPFARTQQQRRWKQDPATGAFTPEQYEAFRPQFEFVPLWDYYPDMTATHLHQMDGQYHRKVLTKSGFRELADRPDFFGGVVTAYIKNHPKGNWREKSHETALRTMGVQSNVNVLAGSKYELIVWDGMVPTELLRSANIELLSGYSNDMVEASVWMIDNEIVRCDMSPWVELEPTQRVQIYHHFIFEEDDSSLLGNGLPNIVRDSQMAISASARMLLDNASIVCGPNLEVNMEMMEPGQDTSAIQPYKIWYRNGTGPEAQIPAVKNVQIDSHIEDLKGVVELFQGFADQETFVNPQTGGDMQKGPSEPFRTAAGASMIQGNAALPFKDVVRNYDAFTISVLASVVLFNKHFNQNPETQGDFQPIARGSSSLIAKEVRGMAYDAIMQTIQPEERRYVEWYGLLKDRLKVRDVDISDVVCDEDEAKKRDEAASQKQAQDEASMAELMKAEVRKLLADATKALTGADTNNAKAAVTFFNAVLAGLESGVTPADIHAAQITGKVPDQIARGFRLKSGKDKLPTKTGGKK